MSEENLKELKNINIKELNDIQILTIFNIFKDVDQRILDTELKSFQTKLIAEGIDRGLFKMKKE